MLAALVLALAQTSPEDAVRSFRVADGFRLELVAAEPMVIDPVALAFDEDGRLYVAEMRDYPLGPPAGTIRLLEDLDGDGRMDRATIFAEHLAFPSAVHPWRGGVLVAAGFEVVYLKDTDGDRKADVRRTVLAGFGRGNAQHLVNGFQLGLDGWIWASNGLSGGTINGVKLQGTDFRFRPDSGEIEAVSGNSQYGQAFDEWGRRFLLTHDNHAIHAVLPREALLRRPHVAPPPVQDSLSDHGNIPRLFPASERDKVFTTDTDSSCGVLVWRGQLLVCEPVLNLVHRDRLAPRGASFAASRADEKSEFLASRDPWSRPVFLAHGPDGALYVGDMQRAVIEHPEYIPKAIQPKLDLRAGTDRGRVFRVLSADAAPPTRFPTSTTADLVAQLDRPEPWRRLTAHRLLLEREARDAAPLLRAAATPLGRLHALRLLHSFGLLEKADLDRALRDPEPGVREHAVRLAPPDSLRDDPDPRVRLEIALATDDPEILAGLARDAADPWMRHALVLSGSVRPLELVKRLPPDPALDDVVRRLAAVVASRADPAETAAWLAAALDDERRRRPMLEALRRGARVDDPETARRLAELAARALAVAADRAAEPPARVDAVSLAALLLPADGPPALEKLLRPAEPQEVQVAVLRALASWRGDPLGPRLFDGWPERTAALRREIVQAALSRPDRVKELLDRVERGAVRPVDLEAPHRADLARHPDRALRERAKSLLQPKGSADREEVIAEIGRKLEKLAGDRARGERVFKTSCATCHRLRGEGIKVGADLEAAVGRDRKALLIDLLDPNRAMDPNFQVFVAKTTSGAVVNGIVSAETPSAITLRRAAGEETTLLRSELVELKAWPASLMPEGLEINLSAQDFADLLEFLGARP